MKKFVFFGIFAAMATSSCKKTYVCVCTATNAGSSSVQRYEITDTKKAARETCDLRNATYTGVTVTCELEL